MTTSPAAQPDRDRARDARNDAARCMSILWPADRPPAHPLPSPVSVRDAATLRVASTKVIHIDHTSGPVDCVALFSRYLPGPIKSVLLTPTADHDAEMALCRTLAGLLSTAGWTHLDSGDTDRAALLFFQAEQLASVAGALDMQVRIKSRVANLFRRLGQPHAAYAEATAAHDIARALPVESALMAVVCAVRARCTAALGVSFDQLTTVEMVSDAIGHYEAAEVAAPNALLRPWLTRAEIAGEAARALRDSGIGSLGGVARTYARQGADPRETYVARGARNLATLARAHMATEDWGSAARHLATAANWLSRTTSHSAAHAVAEAAATARPQVGTGFGVGYAVDRAERAVAATPWGRHAREQAGAERAAAESARFRANHARFQRIARGDGPPHRRDGRRP